MVKQVLDNKKVSAVLQEVALLLELKGENPFKVKAYSNAARTIEILEEDLGGMVREGRLKEMKESARRYPNTSPSWSPRVGSNFMKI